MLSYIEKGYLDELFNRDGYVLDFSTNGFDEFTFQSIKYRDKVMREILSVKRKVT